MRSYAVVKVNFFQHSIEMHTSKLVSRGYNLNAKFLYSLENQFEIIDRSIKGCTYNEHKVTLR